MRASLSSSSLLASLVLLSTSVSSIAMPLTGKDSPAEHSETSVRTMINAPIAGTRFSSAGRRSPQKDDSSDMFSDEELGSEFESMFDALQVAPPTPDPTTSGTVPESSKSPSAATGAHGNSSSIDVSPSKATPGSKSLGIAHLAAGATLSPLPSALPTTAALDKPTLRRARSFIAATPVSAPADAASPAGSGSLSHSSVASTGSSAALV